MSIKWGLDGTIMGGIRDVLPPPFEQVFPYRLVIIPTQMYVSLALHEAFHAFQAETRPERFEATSEVYSVEELYPFDDEVFRTAWRNELTLLARALRAESDTEVEQLAREFLVNREDRRQTAQLDDSLIAYETHLEWLEGLARYVELRSWELAFTTKDYDPLPEMLSDPDFRGYETYARRWTNELSQFSLQAASDGDTRFYYSGMAQAVLLDRMMPGWKERIMTGDFWLEDLLAEAVR